MRTCVKHSNKELIKELMGKKKDLIEIKVETIIEKFLERNKGYIIEIYIINAVNDAVMSLLYIPIERNVDKDEGGITITWESSNIDCNHCSLLYDEIMDCYEELIEPTFQSVSAILKNGIKIQFECIGIKA